jgi:hypothetical protein
MTDPHLGHNWNRHGLDNLLDNVRITLETGRRFKSKVLASWCTATKPDTCHTCDTACNTNICRHTFQCHDGTRASLFSYACLGEMATSEV